MLGLPEGAEGQNPAAFTEHLLRISPYFAWGEDPQDATHERPEWCSATHLYFSPAEFLGHGAEKGEETGGAALQQYQTHALPRLLGGNASQWLETLPHAH